MAENVVETILVKLGLDASSYSQDADKAVKKNEKLNKSIGETDKIVGTVGKTLGKFFSVIATATGIAKLIDDVQRLNDELYHLEKNLGMSSTTIKAWQGAAGAMGGSADGMTSSMKSLNMAMNDFVIMGDTSMLPYMNALGVSMVGANGKLKDTNDVMLDLADSFSKMDREQAFSIASKMGIDEGTFNTLVQGRKEMEKMIEYQKTMYQSSEAELQVSRDLAKNRALLGQHWESMKTMMGNILMPLFLKVSEVLLGLFDYLQKHQREVKAVFTGLAFIVGAVLTPVLIKAAIAAAAFLAPILLAAAPVIALGAAFGLLYDDYKTWADGGKSLFDWGLFGKYIDSATLSTDNLRNAFSNLVKDMLRDTIPTLTGYAEILNKLMSGDFKGAAAQAKEMIGNFSERVTGYVDTATGNEQGTLSNTIGEGIYKILNGGKTYSEVNGGESTYQAPSNKKQHSSSLKLSEQDIVDIMKVASTEVVPSLKGKDFEQQSAGVIDTILNRAASGKFGEGVRGVANQRWAFSDINAPRKGAYGSVENVPMSRVSPKMEAFVRDYLAKRAAGLESSVGQNLSYANPNYLGEASASTKAWVSEVEAQAAKTGQRYGSGKAVHVHGTPTADRSKMPSAFGIQVPNSAAGAQQSIRQGTNQIPSNMRSASVNNRIDTKIGDINVYTTASSITGVAQDAAGAFSNQIGMMTPTLG